MNGLRSKSFGLIAACLLGAAAGAGATSNLPAQAQTPQQVVVRGSVVDDRSGEPVVGATVAAEGTDARAVSSDSGAFTLVVPNANVTLVVSRIGFAQSRLALGGRTTITVRLSRVAVTLSQVVVVGYGTQKRSDVTGSVASISPERLEDKPNTNLAQAIEGSLPGVSVTTTGAGAEPNLNIQIRGRKSITASTQPLVVVDGIPYAGDLAEINPGDIATIDILKDASSAAIYGSRGSNGVILVTTKKGTSGKPRFSYSGYAGSQEVANVPRLMTADEFAAFKCTRLQNDARNANAAVIPTCAQTLTATELAHWATGMNTDWVGVGTRTGRQQQHDLSVSGGSDDTKYYIGGSLLNVDGVSLNDEFDRVNARVNLDQRVKSWLSLGTNTQAARTDRSGIAVSFGDAFFANPLLSPFEADGRTVDVSPWPEDPNTRNPLERTLAADDDINYRLFSSNYVQVNVPRVTGLSYRLNGGFDFAPRSRGNYYGVDTRTGAEVGGQAAVVEATRNDWTLEHLLKYTRVFGRHSLDLTGLYSGERRTVETDSVYAIGFPNDVLGYRSNVALSTIRTPDFDERRMISHMGRLNYSFADRYLLTVTARRDGYSGFGANTKYGVFPSVAVGWNLGNESFLPFRNSINVFKLRASYGENGNQAVTPYRTLSRLDDRSYVNGTNATLPGYIPTTLGNPDLGWETTKSFDFGLDLSLWRDRVTVTVDGYRSRTYDLLLNRSISSVHGITSITQNIGRTANKGIELQLGTVNLDRGGFQWRSDFNVSANRNRIVDLYGNGQSDVASGWFIGQPITVNYEYRFDGIWQLADTTAIKTSAQPSAKPGDVRVKDINGDNKIDANDRVFIGSRQPRYIAGLMNTLKYRRLSASAFLYTVQGVTRQNDLLGTNLVFSDVRRNAPLRTYWTPENGINNYPLNSATSNPLGVGWFEDASFVRLRDVTVSYDLPRSLLGRTGGESLRLYVSGRNLWTQTDWSGLDPELTEQRAVPLEKVFIGGLSLRF